MKKGLFIVFEGIDGCGKSTQTLQTKKWLESNGYKCEITQEPTESDIGKLIRRSIRGNSCEFSSLTQVLLFSADRMNHIDWIKYQIDKGNCVLCDRFIDSTYAYQVATQDEKRIFNVIEETILAIIQPSITFYLDLPVLNALDRIKNRCTSDCYEKKEFLEKVYSRYTEKISTYPQRYSIISSIESTKVVFDQIKKTLKNYIGGAS